MAKFCKYCGKELKPKEKCNCINQEEVEKSKTKKENTELKRATEIITKEVNESGKRYAKKIFEICQNIITNPKQTGKEYFENDDFNITMIILILTSLLIGISTVSFLKGILIGEYFSWNGHQVWNISYFKILLCVSLGVFLSYILLAVIFDLGFEKISQAKISFKKALTTISISALEPTIYCIIGAFLTIISYKLAFIIIIYAAILFLINLYHYFKENIEPTEHYNQLFSILILIFLFLAIYLIPQVFL